MYNLPSHYHLPSNYRRQIPIDFDDHQEGNGWVWQPDVYEGVVGYARLNGITRIIDVGCGAARKIAPYVDEFDVIGLDRPEIVNQIDLPGEWIAHDLDAPGPLPVDCTGAVIVCSDVIEHMVHPEYLALALVDARRDAAHVTISTPDRARTSGRDDRGPCPNRHHAQEWTLDELTAWLTELGFTIADADWTRSNDHEPDLATCLVQC